MTEYNAEELRVTAPVGAHPKVLLVEDTVAVRKLLCAVLQRFDFEVIEAANGAEALQQLDMTRPDIVVTDLQMPVMDGRQLLAQVKNSANTSSIPVVILSADFDSSLESELVGMGAARLMMKTGLHKELIAYLHKLLA